MPAVTRKKKKEVLFRDYLTLCKDVSRNHIDRTSFLQVCPTLTARDSKRKSAVDYVVGELVNDTMNELKRVMGVFMPAEKKENMLCLLEKAEYFLKSVFMECHIGNGDDGYLCRNYTLQEHSEVESNTLTRRVACRGCLTPFKVLNEVKSYVPVERADALHIIEDSRNKFIRYYAHLHRVKTQQAAIESTAEEIAREKLYGRVIMLADYKMKFEALRFREKTLEFFGKKGIFWHGIVVFYLPVDVAGSANHTNGTGTELLSMLFYDHIVQGDSKQDVFAVASILEAAFMRLKQHIPENTEVVLLSDNAGCYQNSTLPIMLPFIARSNGLTAVKFLHTETQDGKSLVDAHFATSMRHVNKYVARGHDATTPSGLVTELKSEDGLANTAAELVKVSRIHHNMIAWEELRSNDNAGLAWIGRNNEYAYGEWSDDDKKISVCLYRYSAIGEPRWCQFSRKGACRPRSNEMRNERHTTVGASTVLTTLAEQQQPNANPADFVTGAETGITVYSESSIRRIVTRRNLKRKSRIRPGLLPTAIELTRDTDDITELENVERTEDGTPGDRAVITCKDCQRAFTSEARLSQHSKYYQPGSIDTDKSIKAKAVRRALELLQSRDINISPLSGDGIVEGIEAEGTEVPELAPGWARREIVKGGCSRDYVELYKNELQEMFDAGSTDNAKK